MYLDVLFINEVCLLRDLPEKRVEYPLRGSK